MLLTCEVNNKEKKSAPHRKAFDGANLQKRQKLTYRLNCTVRFTAVRLRGGRGGGQVASVTSTGRRCKEENGHAETGH